MKLEVVNRENDYRLLVFDHKNILVKEISITYMLKYTSNWKNIGGMRVIQIINWLKEHHPETIL